MLGKALNDAQNAEEAARVVVNVADKLVSWDAVTFDLYSAERDEMFSVLNIDLIDGRRTDVPPAYFGPPSAGARRTIETGPQLLLGPQLETGWIPFGDISRPSASK